MKIGYIFYEDECPVVADFCNKKGNLTIEEIEADENGRRFKIVEVVYTQAEIDGLRILELKQALADTDYQAIKFAEGELTEAEFAPIKAQRKAWREEINSLEGV